MVFDAYVSLCNRALPRFIKCSCLFKLFYWEETLWSQPHKHKGVVITTYDWFLFTPGQSQYFQIDFFFIRLLTDSASKSGETSAVTVRSLCFSDWGKPAETKRPSKSAFLYQTSSYIPRCTSFVSPKETPSFKGNSQFCNVSTDSLSLEFILDLWFMQEMRLRCIWYA